MSDSDLEKLPDIKFIFKVKNANDNDEVFEVVMGLDSYIEDVGDGKYAYRIYFTEEDGSILGANFMNGSIN
jgi:hypothetical protein